MQMRTLTAAAGAILLSLASVLAAPRGATTAPQAPGPAAPGPGKLAMPDLVIVQITKGPGARAQIRNQGNGNAPASILGVTCHLGSTATGLSVKTAANLTVPALKAGGAVWISLGDCKPVDAVIDPDKVIKESSESNNSFSVKS